MGRPCAVTDEEIILLIQKYIEYFRSNNFPVSSAPVWNDMSKELKGKWKSHTVYTHVRENKKNHLQIAREKLGLDIQYQKPGNINYVDVSDEPSDASESSKSNSDLYVDEDEEMKGELFGLVLSPSEWDSIKPDKDSKSQKRLKSRAWAGVISKAFWRLYKFPCAFLAKWSYLRERCDDTDGSLSKRSSLGFCLKFKAKCKCGNVMTGSADEKPLDGKLKLTIEVTRDTRSSYHEEYKRPLNGPERKVVGKELKRRIPVRFRQELLADNMGFGENEPPWIQKPHIYRQVKTEMTKEELGIKSGAKTDTMEHIRAMLSNPRYRNVIREIGGKRFFVFYCTQEQIFVQKEYCRVQKAASRICLDATGSVIKKFELFPGYKTGHIFLYTVTINFEGKTLPVYQMLSEKHNAAFITFWLKEWVQSYSATIPNEAVADFGRALLLAMCDAFNRMTLKEYIDVLFIWASRDGHRTPRPYNTTIRVDVAHLMAAASRWTCIKTIRHSAIKGFYLRAVALLIDAQTVKEFERVFRLTCLVALQEDESESIILSGKKISILEARQLLEEEMAERRETITNLESSIGKVEIEEEVEKTFNGADEKCERNLTVTHRWVKNLILQSTLEHTQESTCASVNAFYLPELIQHLERIGKEFPIWSAACLPEKRGHASTAVQERYFSELKRKTFEGIPLPCAAHRFLKEHIDDLQCGANEIASKLKHYNHRYRDAISFPADAKEKKLEQTSKLSAPPRTDHGSDASSPETVPFSSNKESVGVLQASPSTPGPPDTGTQKSLHSSTPIETNPRATSDGSVDMDYGSVSLLYKKARMVNDSDLNRDEMWMGLCNKETFMDVDEPDTENEEHQTNSADLSYEVRDFTTDNGANFEPQDSFSDLNNNSQLQTSLHDHQYSILASNENSPELHESVEERIDSNENKKKMDKNDGKGILHLNGGEKESISTRNEAKINGNDQQQILYPKCDKKKPKKEGAYFQSCPQIKVINNRLKVRGKRAFLLKNGSKSGIMKMGDIAVDLQETCGFDAIMNLLQFGAICNPNYHSFVKLSHNKALQFLAKVIETGTNSDVLRQRIVLLSEFYPLLENSKAPSIKVYRMNVNDSITTIWKHLFCSEPAEPSATRSRVCSNTLCIQSLPTDIPFFEVNVRKINSKGIEVLQEAVIFHEHYYNVKCRRKDCQGIVTETIRPNPHIFIDLDTRTQTTWNKMIQCSLADIPVSLHFAEKYRYRLIGVVEYISQHFISYGRKLSGQWVQMDDMAMEIIDCKETKKITPIGAIYVAYEQHDLA